MSESSTLAKAVIFLGIMFVLIGLLGNSFPAYSGANAGWNTLTSTLQAGPSWPTFVNPFDPQWQKGSATVNGPTYLNVGIGTSNISFVGCSNATLSRAHCLDSSNNDTAYMSMSIPDATISTRSQENIFMFNWTNRELANLTGAKIGSVTFSVRCNTVSTGQTLSFRVYWWGVTFSDRMFCPRSAEPQTVTWQSTDNGTFANPLLFTNNVEALLVAQPDIHNRTYASTAHFSYLSIEVVYAAAAQECRAPQGAWFPFLDEVACSIANFGQVVWKGIQFFINGVVFILTSIFAILAFLGSVVGGFFLGIFSATTFFLNVPNIPPFVGALIAAIFIGLFAFIVFIVVKVLRGTGSVG